MRGREAAARVDAICAGVTTTYRVRDRGAVLIDPGGVREAGIVTRRLERLLAGGEGVTLMIATHGHFDHVGAATVLRERRQAPLAVHRGDTEWVRRGTWIWPPALTAWGRMLRAALAPVLCRAQRFSPTPVDLELDHAGLDLRSFGVPARVEATPGHSPGSMSVLLDRGEAVAGDLAMNGLPMTVRPSFGIFAHHPEQIPASWRLLRELDARVIHPAHSRPFPAAAWPTSAALDARPET